MDRLLPGGLAKRSLDCEECVRFQNAESFST